MGLVFLFIQGKKSNSSQLFFCIVPRSDSPNWSVSRGKGLLWSVGNVNTLSDLRHCPDVPHVNISKYRLWLRSHAAQHTYIYFVCTQTRTAGVPDVIDGSHLCLGGFVPDLCPLNTMEGQRIHCLAFDTAPKTHCLLQRFSVSQASMSVQRFSHCPRNTYWSMKWRRESG